jgi:hypothetical protein
MDTTPDGRPFVEGKTVTGFTNGEEEEVGLTKVVPFLVENELMNLGAVSRPERRCVGESE